MKEIHRIMQQVNKIFKRQNREIDRIIAKYHL